MRPSRMTQGPLSVCETHWVHRVFPSPSKIPYVGFSPVRLQTRSRRRPSQEDSYLYDAQVRSETPYGPKGQVWRELLPGRSRPEALGSPAGYVVRRGQCLLWPHPRHSPPPNVLFSSSVRHLGGEWFPNLICMSFRACHPLDPGGPVGSIRLLLPRPRWSSPSPQELDIHNIRAGWFSRGSCNEAESGSLALRPARLLALHQQGRLLPSFRRTGRPEPTSVITTWANSQFPGPDFHRQNMQPYGLRTEAQRTRRRHREKT